jgi:outer membrane protein assembly factor BamD
MKNLLYFLLVIVLFSSCSEYQKALKNEDAAVKLDMATKMYESGKFNHSLRLIEQIAGVYRGRPDAEQLFYMYAQSYYKTRQYYLAGYQFESFVSAYPKSDKVIEAAFLGAKSYSTLSPVYSLDQTDTNKAIEKLQAQIDSINDVNYRLKKNLKYECEKVDFMNDEILRLTGRKMPNGLK